MVDIVQEMHDPGFQRPESPVFRSSFPICMDEIILFRVRKSLEKNLDNEGILIEPKPLVSIVSFDQFNN